MSRDPLVFESPNAEKEFQIYYAKVLMRESIARRGTAFSHTLAEWAAKARRRALEIDRTPPPKPPQGDLFS